MSGYEKAKEVANKLKEEKLDRELQVADEKGKALASLDEKYFTDNSNVGMEDVEPEDMPTPTLQMIQRTSKVTDGEGRPFVPGTFYYKATRKNFTEITIAMLVFTKQDLPSYNDKSVMEKTYVFLGGILDGDEILPFKMFLRSSGIGAAKQFLGEVKALRRPMYALRVKLSSVKRENEFGSYFVPQFTIEGLNPSNEEIVMLENLAKTYSDNKQKIQAESAEEIKAADDIPFN